MKVRGVDPRDSRWEDNDPTYRVYFWTRHEAPDSDPASAAWASDEYEITGATDVREVLEWADADGRDYVAYARNDDEEGPGLIRLVGQDPIG